MIMPVKIKEPPPPPRGDQIVGQVKGQKHYKPTMVERRKVEAGCPETTSTPKPKTSPCYQGNQLAGANAWHLTVKVRGRAEAHDGAEGAQFPSARGAKQITRHGPLQRLFGAGRTKRQLPICMRLPLRSNETASQSLEATTDWRPRRRSPRDSPGAEPRTSFAACLPRVPGSGWRDACTQHRGVTIEIGQHQKCIHKES